MDLADFPALATTEQRLVWLETALRNLLLASEVVWERQHPDWRDAVHFAYEVLERHWNTPLPATRRKGLTE